MINHTPTPWEIVKVHGKVLGTGLNRKCGLLNVYEMTTNTVFDKATKKDHLKSEANARFIVKACNSHDKLIEALKSAKAFIECYNKEDTFAKNISYGLIIEALALAESEA